MVVIIIVVSVVILILIVIIIANNLFMVVFDKVNKASRMAEQCGRKGAKQQVGLIIKIMIRIRIIDIFITIMIRLS